MGVEAEVFLYTEGLKWEKLDDILLLLGDFCERGALGNSYTPDVDLRFAGIGFSLYFSSEEVLEKLRQFGGNVTNGRMTEGRVPIYDIRFL
ncbi:hypothetical protein J4413_02475 [Candidatus Woesearchaeota archaeon]|nr:hypothetical protein [Candidatus Woesearchaeota archaeon]